ncbi:MAG: 23S rRNA (adenine(2503)-C(2))-methyltransferase RlmN [Verrucomicrobia bacterium]|nr:23S rRNA (adenine(2503)-C(2))-methyltransferase RlmN [Verrucomicrobiota bacterium]MCG2679791.1 23S rRNA (adenine(2503)-C(2))-methyltransferase RlmN [Kiritimatiellia bacterium]MBU4247110.1 23S rRNA (adenine(2503)-C(2))-methyltransferase RlmN [Verrucomicrobiota bacterium]MBU4289996.1 23S rRNA (adenine(2503)-C(2))-methyltransferase RlmN [Verrucomicrobiota bacterium]MBU4428659.1 23S rRNA (adenine(2503)-C(2))-methyltransferase RlmN [Verrucomicrobiota bacterium]
MNQQLLIHDLTRAELKQVCLDLRQPAFRAEQIWNWLYVRRVTAWDEMKNVPAAFRKALAEAWSLSPAAAVQSAGEQGAHAARKLLLTLRDGECVEAVVIPAKGRATVCVSSQVGCKFKCGFCASGQAGFRRNLQAGEMVGEVLAAARELGATPSHVVWMGIGEPLDNYDAVLKAVRIVNDPSGLSVGARRITISTCGIIPGIRRLAEEGLQVELSISLHAPDDALRSRLMPVNRIYPLADLIPACRDYAKKTGRLITFEYTLIRGVNDTAEQAKALARLLKPVHARVNLIPLSEVAEFGGRPSALTAAVLFIAVLERAGINATLRASKGAGVKAACGQLRASRLGDTTGPAKTDS